MRCDNLMIQRFIRTILFLLGVLTLLILQARLIGAWQNHEVLVYAAQIPLDNRLVEVRLFDTHSHLNTPLLQRLDLTAMQVSPDGRSLVFEQRVRREREIQILELTTGTLRTLYAGDVDTARWSPDGRWIAYLQTRLSSAGLFIVPAAGGESRQLSEAFSVYALAADGQWVIYSGWGTNDNPGLIAQSTTSGEKQTLLAAEQLFITDIVASGDWVAFLGNYEPYVLHLPSGEFRYVGEARGTGATLSWSLDGERLLVTGSNQESTSVQVINREGELLATYDLPEKTVSSRVGWVLLR